MVKLRTATATAALGEKILPLPPLLLLLFVTTLLLMRGNMPPVANDNDAEDEARTFFGTIFHIISVLYREKY